MKKILLSLLLLCISITLYAEAKFNDPRLLKYPEARQWSKDADTNGESAYNIGVLYDQQINDDKKAIEWYKKAYLLKDKKASGSSANNLGYIYDDLEKYKKAEKWYKNGADIKNLDAILNLAILYKKSYHADDMAGAHGLGLLYKSTLNKPNEAIKWYKKAAKAGYADSIKNLARYYNLEKHDKVLGGAYFIALIDIKYPKQKVLNYLKTKWKLTDKELQEAYKVQLVLDIPKHYYDPELENKPLPKKKTGRR